LAVFVAFLVSVFSAAACADAGASGEQGGSHRRSQQVLEHGGLLQLK